MSKSGCSSVRIVLPLSFPSIWSSDSEHLVRGLWLDPTPLAKAARRLCGFFGSHGRVSYQAPSIEPAFNKDKQHEGTYWLLMLLPQSDVNISIDCPSSLDDQGQYSTKGEVS